MAAPTFPVNALEFDPYRTFMFRVLIDGKPTQQSVYNADGKEVKRTTPSGTTLYGYDQFGREVSAERSTGTTS